MKIKNTPVRKTMCASCPFRPGSKYACLASDLASSAIAEASRICHSTGTNGLLGKTGKPAQLCRGARNVQLAVFCSLGVIEAPTDAAWDKRAERKPDAKA